MKGWSLTRRSKRGMFGAPQSPIHRELKEIIVMAAICNLDDSSWKSAFGSGWGAVDTPACIADGFVSPSQSSSANWSIVRSGVEVRFGSSGRLLP